MSRILALAATVATLAACAPVGSGDGELPVHTGWRGIISAGPASEDGAIACGIPPTHAFDCEAGASVRIGKGWMGCARPEQSDIGPNGVDAAGDFIIVRPWDRNVVFIGRSQGGATWRVACVSQEDKPARFSWASIVREAGSRSFEHPACWDPDTGDSVDCARMGL